VTDARVIRHGRGRRTVLAAAASGDLLAAIAQGCEQAGLVLDAIGPACEVVPLVTRDASRATTLTVETAAGTEQLDLVRGVVCRSRLIRANCTPTHGWVPQLASLGELAGRFATAFSATKARPRLSLLPDHTRARAAAQHRRRVRWLIAAALVAWLMAGVVFLARLRLADARTRAELAASATMTESVRRLHRDLDSANAALTTMRQAEASRSSTFLLLERLTRLLGDSVIVVSVRITRDSTLHLAGYAPTADRVVATLERMQGVERPRLEEPPNRQVLTMADGRRREWDRFGIVAQLARRP